MTSADAPEGLHRETPDPRAYGRSFADVYDDWYGHMSDPQDVVRAVDRLMGPTSSVARSPIVELGVGTGRLAIPLTAAGYAVVGLDASVPMLRRMEAKAPTPLDHPLSNPPSTQASALVAGPSRPAALAGDMVELPLAGHSVAGVVIAFNTFFNLDGVSGHDNPQLCCLAEIQRVLRPGGWLAMACFVTAGSGGPAGEGTQRDAPQFAISAARVSRTQQADDRAVLIVTAHDAAHGRLTGAHLEFGPDGLRVRPWRLRPLTPPAIDRLAASAGLVLEARWQDWRQRAFAPHGDRHVSIYRKPSGQPGPATPPVDPPS